MALPRFSLTPTCPSTLQMRTRGLRRRGLLSENVLTRSSIDFLLGDADPELVHGALRQEVEAMKEENRIKMLESQLLHPLHTTTQKTTAPRGIVLPLYDDLQLRFC
ncbi:hypothetical protein PI125_g9693 [Phytophthora idaei]|nr:hypothetical protein PI125_g9693 [Phytophthora idaei]